MAISNSGPMMHIRIVLIPQAIQEQQLNSPTVRIDHQAFEPLTSLRNMNRSF